MKGLMKGSYDSSAMWRGWRGIGSPREYVGKCAGSRTVSRPQKRWIDTMKEYLRKRGLDVRQAWRIVQDRSECWGFTRRDAWGIARGMNPDLHEMPQLWVATAIGSFCRVQVCSVAEPIT